MMNYTLLAIILLEETEILSEAAWQYIFDEHLQFNHINMEADRPNIEVIWFELIPTKSKNILFGSLPRPPNFDASGFLQEVESIRVN